MRLGIMTGFLSMTWLLINPGSVSWPLAPIVLYSLQSPTHPITQRHSAGLTETQQEGFPMRPLTALLTGLCLMAALAAVAGSGAALSAQTESASLFTVHLPLVAMDQPRIRLAALYYDSETSGEADEAFRL
jgi:hypothetical protein